MNEEYTDALLTADDLLRNALRNARLAHAAQVTAIGNLRSAAILRLEMLKEELAPAFAAHSRARDVVDLSLITGDPPRLWVDLSSYVVMSPTPGTYSYQRDRLSGTEILIESNDCRAVRDRIVAEVAGQMVRREKVLHADAAFGFADPRNNTRESWIVYTWLTGFTTGACLVLTVASLG